MRELIYLNQGWEFALHKGFGPMDMEAADKLAYVPVTLPHDWAIACPVNRQMEQGEAQGYIDRWGIGWYRRGLRLIPEEGRQYRLHFNGIYENSSIWVNGIYAGGRKYGYSGFDIDITELVTAGDNHLLVKADNTGVPADRWYSGAGIYRDVYLEQLPAVHLEREEIKISTLFEGDGAAAVIDTGMQDLLRPDEGYRLTVVLEKDGRTYTATGAGTETVLRLQVPAHELKLWSARTPELYDVTVRLTGKDGQPADEIHFRIGFRQTELSADKGLLINGEPVKLKGVCIHQEAGCFGTAVNKEIWRERFRQLKELGCNALRLAHHLFMPEILELSDEIGFYVYEECFDKWTGGAYGRYYRSEWEKDIEAMVKRDRNHPSILFWGVGNEVENQAFDSMLNLLERHVEKVKSLDETRPVSIAMNPHFPYPAEEVDLSQVKDIQQFVDEMKSGEIFDMDERVEQIKLIAARVDFICCNYMEQWYDRIHRAIPDKVILGSEIYMYFRGYEENFQNYSDRNPWLDVEANDYCIGGMLWAGYDYLGESMGYPAKGWSGALMATDMEKRPIAWQYQSYWSEEPMVHFAVMDYSLPDEGAKEHWDYPRYMSHWEFPQFRKVVIPYMIATNCEEVELMINERNFLLPRPKECPNRTITGFLPYYPGTVTVIGKNGGTEVCRQVLRTPGPAVGLAFEQEEQEIALASVPAGTGEAIIRPYQVLLKVRAFDYEGNPVFRESAKVRFRVEGPAELIGVDNGDIQSAEPYCNDAVHLYNGRAGVALRITGSGRVRVSAFASGMRMAQTIITAADGTFAGETGADCGQPLIQRS